jgi:hypothetical protein
VAVIVAASDETYRDKFVYAGVLAPVKYWENIFAPKWAQEVLCGSPNIDCLHVAEIKRPEWRDVVGMSEVDAERRIDNAFAILCKRKEPTWVACQFTHAQFNDKLKQKMRVPTRAVKNFSAEYLGFLGYMYGVLKNVKRMFPDVRKVDFLVERNGEVTKNLPYFYEEYASSMAAIDPTLETGLMGDLIPAGKESLPLQAADLVCWYVRRARENALHGTDLERYRILESKPYVIGLLEDHMITNLSQNLKARRDGGEE